MSCSQKNIIVSSCKAMHFFTQLFETSSMTEEEETKHTRHLESVVETCPGRKEAVVVKMCMNIQVLVRK